MYSQSVHFKLGLTQSNIYSQYQNDNPFVTSPHIGAHGGFFIQFEQNPLFLVESGLELVIKGSKTMGILTVPNLGDIPLSLYMYLLYLEFPLIAKFSVTEGNPTMYGLGGLYLGMGLAGKLVADNHNSYYYFSLDNDVVEWETENGFKRLDFGFKLGVGFKLVYFDIELVYSHGLNNFAPANAGYRNFHRMYAFTLVI